MAIDYRADYQAASAGRYTIRYVAFVDMLGSSNLIQQSVDEDEVRQRLVSAYEKLYEAKPAWDRGDESREGMGESLIGLVHHNWEVHAFSDCVAMSTVHTPAGLEWMLIQLAKLQLNLLRGGVLSRGGIAVGPLLHNEKVVLGTALLRAIEIERNEAVVPRVVADEEIVGASDKAAKKLLKKDSDDRHFIDFAECHEAFVKREWTQDTEADAEQWKQDVQETRVRVAALLKKTTNLRHRPKLDWLSQYLGPAASSNGSGA